MTVQNQPKYLDCTVYGFHERALLVDILLVKLVLFDRVSRLLSQLADFAEGL
jgi:hypothetical protein